MMVSIDPLIPQSIPVCDVKIGGSSELIELFRDDLPIRRGVDHIVNLKPCSIHLLNAPVTRPRHSKNSRWTHTDHNQVHQSSIFDGSITGCLSDRVHLSVKATYTASSSSIPRRGGLKAILPHRDKGSISNERCDVVKGGGDKGARPGGHPNINHLLKYLGVLFLILFHLLRKIKRIYSITLL